MSEPRTNTPLPSAAPESRWSDHDVDQLIGRLLQIGVLFATIVVLIGSAMLLARQGSATIDFSHFAGSPRVLRTVGGTFRLAMAGDPVAIVQLGLVLLIATPIARVALTFCAFVVQRDRVYVLLTTIVLVLLLIGLF